MENKNILRIFTNQTALQPVDLYENYAITLKYLLRVIDDKHPSYDFLLRLASFATSGQLSEKQKTEANKIIKHFEKQGFFNDIPDYFDIADFCFKNNLKRVKLDSFFCNLEEYGFRIESNILYGFVDWRKLLKKENKKEIERLIPIVKEIKKEDKKIRKAIISSGTILSETIISYYKESLKEVYND